MRPGVSTQPVAGLASEAPGQSASASGAPPRGYGVVCHGGLRPVRTVKKLSTVHLRRMRLPSFIHAVLIELLW